MPYRCSLNTDNCLDYLGNLSAMIENLNCTNLCIMRDYNADEKNCFGNLVDSFSEENELVISDYELLPLDSFTFVSEAHGTTSWLDHRLISKSMFNCVKNISVLMEYITSDHLPLSVVFSYDHLPNMTKLPQPYNNAKLHWEKQSREEPFQYHEASAIALVGIKLNEEITNCSDQFCTRTAHLDAINQLHHDLTSAFILASSGLAWSPRIPQNPAIIPGWNDKVKTLHSVAHKIFYYGLQREGQGPVSPMIIFYFINIVHWTCKCDILVLNTCNVTHNKINVAMQKAQHISSHHKQSNERCEGPCADINQRSSSLHPLVFILVAKPYDVIKIPLISRVSSLTDHILPLVMNKLCTALPSSSNICLYSSIARCLKA